MDTESPRFTSESAFSAEGGQQNDNFEPIQEGNKFIQIDVSLQGKVCPIQVELYNEQMPNFTKSVVQSIEGKKVTGRVLFSTQQTIGQLALRLDDLKGPILNCRQKEMDAKSMGTFLDLFYNNCKQWERPETIEENVTIKKGTLVLSDFEKKDGSQPLF